MDSYINGRWLKGFVEGIVVVVLLDGFRREEGMWFLRNLVVFWVLFTVKNIFRFFFLDRKFLE